MVVWFPFFIAGCAYQKKEDYVSKNYSLSSETNIASDRNDMDFKFGNIYAQALGKKLSAEDFSNGLNSCILFQVESYMARSENVRIQLSLGSTQDEIIDESTYLCLEAKGWALYEEDGGQVVRVDSMGIRYSDMPEWQLKIAQHLILSQREWYLQYAPEVLEVGDSLQK
ncbi:MULTISPECIES: hypothetical protein [unclassified Pseudomonas]|uniref:hypothetical protein n=1 Tax=unclassified Pseudomonas TaxID=196821 RepID=UPI00111C778C|nr:MULTISPECIES: hypothetical protein [unclassified Pseudomonas]